MRVAIIGKPLGSKKMSQLIVDPQWFPIEFLSETKSYPEIPVFPVCAASLIEDKFPLLFSTTK
jgi:hypothetical protein